MRVKTSVDMQTGIPTRNLIIEDIIARTDIDDSMIERLVRGFCGRARLDPLIGPVFESKVHDGEGHIGRMCTFWSSIVLMSGRYHGQPMVAHLPLPIDPPYFDRWLEIFASIRSLVSERRIGSQTPGLRSVTHIDDLRDAI